MLKLYGLYQDKEFPNDFLFILKIKNSQHIMCFYFDGDKKLFNNNTDSSEYILSKYFHLFKQYDKELSFKEFEQEIIKIQQLNIFQ